MKFREILEKAERTGQNLFSALCNEAYNLDSDDARVLVRELILMINENKEEKLLKNIKDYTMLLDDDIEFDDEDLEDLNEE